MLLQERRNDHLMELHFMRTGALAQAEHVVGFECTGRASSATITLERLVIDAGAVKAADIGGIPTTGARVTACLRLKRSDWRFMTLRIRDAVEHVRSSAAVGTRGMLELQLCGLFGCADED
jgi:hypothetical protein